MRLTAAFFVCTLCVLLATPGHAEGKVGIYGVYMTPYGSDARDYTRAGWGGGLQAVFPLEQLNNMWAFGGGFEIVNLMSENKTFIDPRTRLRTEQQTSQNYYRLYLGAEIGPHGNGFLRPHAGVNVAGILYSISTDLVVPDDYIGGNEIRQSTGSNTKVVFGYDLTLGMDLNFSTFVIDGGVKYLKTFSLPQQLGEGSVTVHPQYFQIYLGVGMPFSVLEGLGKHEGEG